jgi:acyl dehydratase
VAPRSEAPDRRPDQTLSVGIADNAAALFRLLGDRNPLHIDPRAYGERGYGVPVLHGLCTYGTVCRELIGGLCRGDVRAVASYSSHFAAPTHPGDLIEIRIWESPGRRASYETHRLTDGILLCHGQFTWR